MLKDKIMKIVAMHFKTLIEAQGYATHAKPRSWKVLAGPISWESEEKFRVDVTAYNNNPLIQVPVIVDPVGIGGAVVVFRA